MEELSGGRGKKNVKEAPGTQRAERSLKELGVSHWIQVRKKNQAIEKDNLRD